ncbi:hypothetical protein GOP47_0014124 [Adiantum capillus-veneris]|uniref:Extensin-like n=1 Tax=Adiantum capillus-veneris TaxID=13818 RepID=A0A9D4ZDV5_ADICA|nr:hypothetical protein GOP47_0014124 [Adiantum capillus-veneris]
MTSILAFFIKSFTMSFFIACLNCDGKTTSRPIHRASKSPLPFHAPILTSSPQDPKMPFPHFQVENKGTQIYLARGDLYEAPSQTPMNNNSIPHTLANHSFPTSSLSPTPSSLSHAHPRTQVVSSPSPTPSSLGSVPSPTPRRRRPIPIMFRPPPPTSKESLPQPSSQIGFAPSPSRSTLPTSPYPPPTKIDQSPQKSKPPSPYAPSPILKPPSPIESLSHPPLEQASPHLPSSISSSPNQAPQHSYAPNQYPHRPPSPYANSPNFPPSNEGRELCVLSYAFVEYWLW